VRKLDLRGGSESYLKLEAYLVPIDTIEKETGLNFLDRLDDSIENPLEARAATKQDLDLSE
jgi:DNA/RNA endonuclease G (NUC1)